MTEVNSIDKPITKGMILAEKLIRFHRIKHPWSPPLTKALLDVQFWKITLYFTQKKQSLQKTIDNIIN